MTEQSEVLVKLNTILQKAGCRKADQSVAKFGTTSERDTLEYTLKGLNSGIAKGVCAFFENHGIEVESAIESTGPAGARVAPRATLYVGPTNVTASNTFMQKTSTEEGMDSLAADLKSRTNDLPKAAAIYI